MNVEAAALGEQGRLDIQGSIETDVAPKRECIKETDVFGACFGRVRLPLATSGEISEGCSLYWLRAAMKRASARLTVNAVAKRHDPHRNKIKSQPEITP